MKSTKKKPKTGTQNKVSCDTTKFNEKVAESNYTDNNNLFCPKKISEVEEYLEKGRYAEYFKSIKSLTKDGQQKKLLNQLRDEYIMGRASYDFYDRLLCFFYSLID